MKNPIYLSVIIPLHNEAQRLDRCLDQLIPVVGFYKSYEIILVDNGSTDDTPRLCELAQRIYPGVEYIRLNERGKGLAVRTGMLAASGRYRYMCDVDLSTPAKEIYRFIEFIRVYDVVIGSREKDKTTVKADVLRHVIGRILHQAVDGLVPGFMDTQCGFKMFRDYAAMQIFADAHVDGVAFDVEALQLARLLHYHIHEMPVTWQHDEDSRMRWTDGLDFLLDVLSLYGRAIREQAVTARHW